MLFRSLKSSPPPGEALEEALPSDKRAPQKQKWFLFVFFGFCLFWAANFGFCMPPSPNKYFRQTNLNASKDFVIKFALFLTTTPFLHRHHLTKTDGRTCSAMHCPDPQTPSLHTSCKNNGFLIWCDYCGRVWSAPQSTVNQIMFGKRLERD